MDNIIPFNGLTTLPLDPADMLKAIASQNDIESIWVIVARKNGETTYHSTDSSLDLAYYKAGEWMHRIIKGEFS